MQIGAKGRKNEPGLVASKDMGNNCACRWTIHENSGCNVLTFAIPGPIGPHRAPSGPIGPHRLKKSSLCRFLCNDSFVTSLYAGPFARYPTLSRSNCGEGMVKSPSVSSAPQNEHMTKQHKPDVGSEDSQPLNAKSLQCCATTSHSHAKSLQRTK